MNRLLLSMSIAAAITALAGCPGDLEHPERFSGEPTCPTPIDVPAMLAQRCGSSICHGGPNGQSGLDLLSPGIEHELVSVPSAQCGGYLRVDPADPDRSFLLMKLTEPPAGCGAKMPIVGLVTPEEFACIRAYVHQIAATLPANSDAGTDASIADAGTDASQDDASIDGGP